MKTKFVFNSGFAMILLLAAGLAPADLAPAAVLSVDINDVSQPANTQSGFSALVTPGGAFTNLSGIVGGVTVSIGALGEPLQSAARSLPANRGNFGEAALYQDFLYGGSTNGNGLSITLSGLTPYQNYTVQIWSFDALSAGSPVSDWTANGIQVANQFSFNTNSVATGSFTFTVPASATGAIYVMGVHDYSQGIGPAVFLNGLRVSIAANPGASNPLTNSWFTTYSGQYARIYTSLANRTNGIATTTWTGQTSPAYDGVREVDSSASWVYIRSSGLGSHNMGPWNNPNLPLNQGTLFRFPRNAAVASVKTNTSLGMLGLMVDGVAIYDTRDAFSYVHGSSQDATPLNHLTGDGVWNRDAWVNEAVSFDPAYAHQPPGGQYHYHANPLATRYFLGDNVNFAGTPVNNSPKTYAENTNTTVFKHSPILGWLADGYPLYGPYGFSNPSNSASPVRRLVSGYVFRDGSNGTANLNSIGRTNLPVWAATAQIRSANLPSNLYGPAVSTTYPLGHYIEDNDYLGDLINTNSATHTNNFQQGVDFDLDKYNGRWCVTPDFTNVIYAYFVAMKSDGTPAFPYNVGRQFNGSVTGGTVASISETVTTNFLGGANSSLIISGPVITNNVVTLTWSATEGGTYEVDVSGDLSTWTTNASGLAAVLNKGSTTTAKVAGGQFFKVTRTALSSYDTK